MPFQKGNKISKGRQKGTITKSRQELIDKSKNLGIDVFEILLRFAANDWKGLGYESQFHVIGKTPQGQDIEVERISPELRQKSAHDAAKYILPSLKAIDVSLDDKDRPINVTFNVGGGSPSASGESEPARRNHAPSKTI